MNKTAHFYLNKAIGIPDPIFKIMTGQDEPMISSKDVVDFLAELPKETTDLVIHINSPGGQVSEGLAMYDAFSLSGKNITTRVEGQASSIASVLMLVGSVREITPYSRVLIHSAYMKPDGNTTYTASQLESITAQMHVCGDQLKAIYKSKTSLDDAAISNYLENETVFNADQALEYGFATMKVEPVKAFAYELPKQEIKKENKEMDLLAEIKKLFIKAEDVSVVASAKKTADGKTINVAGEVAVGSVVTDESGAVVASQTITLEDNSSITTDAEGKITEVTPAVDPLKAANDKIAELEAKLQAKETESIEALALAKTEMEKIMKASKSTHVVAQGKTEFRTGTEAKTNRVLDAFADKK